MSQVPKRDRQLLVRLRRGPDRKAALREVYDKNLDDMLRIAMRRGLRLQEAEDVVHTTICKFFERCQDTSKKRVRDLRAFLFRILRNEAKNLRRYPARGPQPRTEKAEEPDSRLRRAEERQAVQKAMSSLSAEERAIIMLRTDDCPYQEIAEMFNKTVEDMTKKHSRAIYKLRKWFIDE